MRNSFVTINRYWDRTSKVLILIVDAGLNYFFLRTVKLRLVNYHGLTKYAPLVRFNARLMVLSVSMDVSSTSYSLRIMSFSTPAYPLILFWLLCQSSENSPLTLSVQTVDVNLPYVS
jgi:hypothetical protein